MARESSRRVPPGRDLLLQRLPVVQEGVRPLDHPLAVRREAVKPVTTFDDRHAKLLFELPDPAGQRRLRHVTCLRGAREVLFTRKGDKILKLADIHWSKMVVNSQIPNPKTVARQALVVGAGIGGLSAAIALRKAGWEVRVFERSASLRELGFGVGLAPNAMAALGELGVGETVLARGFEPASGEMRRMDGTVLKRATIPRGILGGPFVVAMRTALYGALLDAAGIDTVTAGSEATGFTRRGRRVTLHLANGSSAEGDLLVGADGVRSVIRRQLHPAEPPARQSCIVSVRGAVEGAVAHLGGVDGLYYLGPGVESAHIRASATGIYWFVAVAEELVPEAVRLTDPSTGEAAAGALLAHMAPRFDDTFRAITSATSELRYDGVLVDRDPLPRWGDGIVTLIGDAAHPMLPHTGQGAAQAIVDAVTLGKMLAGSADVEQTLRAFEAERMPKTAALVYQGRRTARFMRIRNPAACYLREAAVRMAPLKTVMKLYVRVNRRAGTSTS